MCRGHSQCAVMCRHIAVDSSGGVEGAVAGMATVPILKYTYL
jgi:hypothetical protein